MKTPDDRSKSTGTDWQRFDLTRWNLQDLNLDAASGTLAGLADKLFGSPEWKQHFTATLPAMKQAVQAYFAQRAESLKAGAAAQEQELKQRSVQAAQESAAFQSALQAATAPPRVKANPDSFQLGARVVDEKTSLGLPGLSVRIIDDRTKGRVLAEGVTDADGNVVLSLSKEEATALAREKIEPSVDVLTPAGKAVYRAAQAVCPRPDYAQTLVASVAEAASEVKPHIELAGQLKAQREARATELRTKADRLKVFYAGLQQRLTTQLSETQAILDDIQKEATAGENDPGPFGPTSGPVGGEPGPSRPTPAPGIARPPVSRVAAKPKVAAKEPIAPATRASSRPSPSKVPKKKKPSRRTVPKKKKS